MLQCQKWRTRRAMGVAVQALVLAACTSFPARRSLENSAHAEVQQLQFRGTAWNLNFEALQDGLIHFEWVPASHGAQNATATRSTKSIPTTPFVLRKDYAGAHSFGATPGIADGFETSLARVQVEPGTLCFSVFDKAQGQMLTRTCPTDHGMTLDRMRIQNAYGLGEQFQKLGEANGDWIGKIRTPGGPYGNALTAFGGGATGNAQIPVLYALGPGTLNYALYLDTVYPLRWDFRDATWDVEKTREGSEPGLRGYFFLGNNLPALRESFMDLVGRPPVPPKKAFGLWVSEFGYRNWGQVRDKLKTLRSNGFPVDGFVLDLYWYGGYQANSPDSRVGSLDWDLTNFPDPKGAIARLHDDGVGLMTIEQSYVSENLSNFSTMAAQGFLAKDPSTGRPALLGGWWGMGGMLDWTNPAAGHAWHELNRRKLADLGVTFHWTDLAEPEAYNPESAYSGLAGTGTRHEDVHNAYAFLWNKSIAEGYAGDKETARHFILSRSGGPGIQRFGSAMWSGDIGSNLRSLASHLNAQMHLSLSGIDYFGADIGGFHREALEGDMNEVYTKWFAHATLFDVPVRPHTDDGDGREMTAPDRIGELKSNLYNLRLRYELAPYYYSLAYRAHLYGEPLFPPPLYYNQSDPNLRTIADEKMIGPALLAVTAASLGENSRSAYLPAGTWIDYHSLQWYRSPQGQSIGPLALRDSKGVYRLPLFARAGAIIPEAQVDAMTMNMLGQRLDGSVNRDLIVRAFEPDANGETTSFDLIEDDGVSEAYQTGAYARTRIAQSRGENADFIIIEPTSGTYAGAPKQRQNRVELVVDPSRSGSIWRVLWNERPLRYYEDPADLKTAWEGWSVDERGVLRIKSDIADVSDTKFFEVDFR